MEYASGAISKYELKHDKHQDQDQTIDTSSVIISAHLSGGNFYEGAIEMKGRGIYKWNDGTLYDGDFQANCQMTGFATYKYTDGSSYSGHVLNGIRFGFGTFAQNGTTPTATAQPQSVQNNKSASPKIKYVGEWENGLRDGEGVLYYNTQTETKTGTGTGSRYYSGKWKNGKREGYGQCMYENGNSYIGEWRADQKCGYGIMKWCSASSSSSAANSKSEDQNQHQIYAGEWSDDKPNGIGVHIVCGAGTVGDQNVDVLKQLLKHKCEISSSDELQLQLPTFDSIVAILNDIREWNWYKGEWNDGKRDGHGIFNYSNGAYYEGNWSLDKKVSSNDNDSSTYVFPNGLIFVGAFMDDEFSFKDAEEQQIIESQMQLPFVVRNTCTTAVANSKLTSQIIFEHWDELQLMFEQCLSSVDQWLLLIELLQIKTIASDNSNNQNMIGILRSLFECLIVGDMNLNMNAMIDITDTQPQTQNKYRFLFREFLDLIMQLITVANSNTNLKNQIKVQTQTESVSVSFDHQQLQSMIDTLCIITLQNTANTDTDTNTNLFHQSREQIHSFLLLENVWRQLPMLYAEQIWPNPKMRAIFDEQFAILAEAERAQLSDEIIDIRLGFKVRCVDSSHMISVVKSQIKQLFLNNHSNMTQKKIQFICDQIRSQFEFIYNREEDEIKLDLEIESELEDKQLTPQNSTEIEDEITSGIESEKKNVIINHLLVDNIDFSQWHNMKLLVYEYKLFLVVLCSILYQVYMLQQHQQTEENQLQNNSETPPETDIRNKKNKNKKKSTKKSNKIEVEAEPEVEIEEQSSTNLEDRKRQIFEINDDSQEFIMDFFQRIS